MDVSGEFVDAFRPREFSWTHPASSWTHSSRGNFRGRIRQVRGRISAEGISVDASGKFVVAFRPREFSWTHQASSWTHFGRGNFHGRIRQVRGRISAEGIFVDASVEFVDALRPRKFSRTYPASSWTHFTRFRTRLPRPKQKKPGVRPVSPIQSFLFPAPELVVVCSDEAVEEFSFLCGLPAPEFFEVFHGGEHVGGPGRVGLHRPPQ